MLVLSRKMEEKIVLGDDITITVIEIRGDTVRLGLEAPRHIKVFRKEVLDAVKTENKAASMSKLPEAGLVALK